MFGIPSVTRQLISTSGRKNFNLIIRQTRLCVACAYPCCCRALCSLIWNIVVTNNLTSIKTLYQALLYGYTCNDIQKHSKWPKSICSNTKGVGGNSSQSKPKAYVCFIVLSATFNNLSVISISFIG